jgi:pyruvate dehydrogenase E1 component alpha subunit
MNDLLRIIGDGKDVPDGEVPEDLSEKDLVEMFRWMVHLRTFDERAVALQRQGRIGTYPMFWGEEATQAGPLYACRESDWLFPSYRQHAIATLRGLPASAPLKYRRGFGGSYGFWDPRAHKVAPMTISIGTHLPHAVGLAWAAKITGEDTASLVWFGDGATSEGDFHEAMNFASLFKVATVFFCVNNQWAISTPVSRQMAVEAIVDKAKAYAMAAVRVDGFDPIACFKVTRDALERGRAGDGPTLIEAFCYRLKAHATADDASLYRDESEAQAWMALEPVGRTAAFLKRLGALDDDTEHAIKKQASELIAEAVAELEEVEPPGPDIIFDHLYASPRPWTLEEGLRDLREAKRRSGNSAT